MYQEGKSGRHISAPFGFQGKGTSQLQLPKLYFPQQQLGPQVPSLQHLKYPDSHSPPLPRLRAHTHVSSSYLNLTSPRNCGVHDSFPKLFSFRNAGSMNSLDTPNFSPQIHNLVSPRSIGQRSANSTPRKLFQSVVRESNLDLCMSKSLSYPRDYKQQQEDDYLFSRLKFEASPTASNNSFEADSVVPFNQPLTDRDSPSKNGGRGSVQLPEITISTPRISHKKSIESFSESPSTRSLKPILKKQSSRYSSEKPDSPPKNFSLCQIDENTVFLMPTEEKRVSFVPLP